MTMKKWFVGMSLAGLMVGVLTLNATLFSARSFQFDFAKIVEGRSGSLNLAEFEAIDARIAQIQAEAKSALDEADAFNARLAPLREQDEALAVSLTEARAKAAEGIAALEQKANVQPTEAAGLLTDAREFDQRVQALSGARGLGPSDQATLADVRRHVDDIAARQTAAAQASAQRAALEAEARSVGERVAQANQAIQAAQADAVGAESLNQYARVREEAFALRNGSPLGLSAMAAAWHPTQLSTVLVLAMGILGAILYLFPAYMSRANPVTFAEIAVRVLFGMCTSLAFYVVANAAITGLGFTSGEGASSGAQHNPFTLSMIGVIAGIMADDIAKWIHRRGTDLLAGAAGVPPAPAADSPPPVGGLSQPSATPASAEEPNFEYNDPQRGQ